MYYSTHHVRCNSRPSRRTSSNFNLFQNHKIRSFGNVTIRTTSMNSFELMLNDSIRNDLLRCFAACFCPILKRFCHLTHKYNVIRQLLPMLMGCPGCGWDSPPCKWTEIKERRFTTNSANGNAYCGQYPRRI